MQPDGLVAVIERWPTAFGVLPDRPAPLLVVAEGIACHRHASLQYGTATTESATSSHRGLTPERSLPTMTATGAADSLNVAVAAGVVLFEAARQRAA